MCSECHDKLGTVRTTTSDIEACLFAFDNNCQKDYNIILNQCYVVCYSLF